MTETKREGSAAREATGCFGQFALELIFMPLTLIGGIVLVFGTIFITGTLPIWALTAIIVLLLVGPLALVAVLLVRRRRSKREEPPIVIRPEQPDDASAIFAVHAASFPTDAEARLVDALRSAGHLSASLVAEVDGAIVGHVAFSPVTVEGSDLVRTGLAPVAVVAAHRRQGIAAALVRRGLEERRRAGDAFCVVLGDPKYYGRFGFEPARRWGMTCVFGGGDAFQAMEWRAGALLETGGLVQYAPEFSLVE